MDTPLKTRGRLLAIKVELEIHAHGHGGAEEKQKRAPVASVAVGHARSLHVCLGIPVRCAQTNFVVNCLLNSRRKRKTSKTAGLRQSRQQTQDLFAPLIDGARVPSWCAPSLRASGRLGLSRTHRCSERSTSELVHGVITRFCLAAVCQPHGRNE